jgi:hypothetical protein
MKIVMEASKAVTLLQKGWSTSHISKSGTVNESLIGLCKTKKYCVARISNTFRSSCAGRPRLGAPGTMTEQVDGLSVASLHP